MIDKILSIQDERNIVAYQVSFNENELKNYLEYLDSLYGYRETVSITALVANNKLLTAGKYDSLKRYCKVDDEFRIIKEIHKDEFGVSNCRVEINVEYFSIVSSVLRETFLTDGILINTTELAKLINVLTGNQTDFVFDEILDLNDRNKSWEEIGKHFLNNSEYQRYVEHKKRNVNLNPIRLNKIEESRIYDDIHEILRNLHNLLKFEQIAMFPISNNLTEVQNVLKSFGQRNSGFESYFGSLEDASINIRGAEIINRLTDQICSYNDIKNNVKNNNNESYVSKVKSFFKF